MNMRIEDRPSFFPRKFLFTIPYYTKRKGGRKIVFSIHIYIDDEKCFKKELIIIFSSFCSSRNGGEGFFVAYWVKRGFDGFFGGELDFNSNPQAERQKSKHVYHDESK